MKQFTLTANGVEYKERQDSKSGTKRLLIELSVLFAVGLAGGAYIVYLVRAPRVIGGETVAFAPNVDAVGPSSSLAPISRPAPVSRPGDSLGLLRAANPVSNSAPQPAAAAKHPIKDAVKWLRAIAHRGSASLRDAPSGQLASPFAPKPRLQKYQTKDSKWSNGGLGGAGGSGASSQNSVAASSGSNAPTQSAAAPRQGVSVIATRTTGASGGMRPVSLFGSARQGASPGGASAPTSLTGNGMGSAVSIGSPGDTGDSSTAIDTSTGDETLGLGVQDGEPDTGDNSLQNAQGAAGGAPSSQPAQQQYAPASSPSSGASSAAAPAGSFQSVGQAAIAATQYAAQLAAATVMTAPAAALLDAQVAAGFATQAVSLAQAGNYSAAAAADRTAMQHLQFVAAVEAAGGH